MKNWKIWINKGIARLLVLMGLGLVGSAFAEFAFVNRAHLNVDVIPFRTKMVAAALWGIACVISAFGLEKGRRWAFVLSAAVQIPALGYMLGNIWGKPIQESVFALTIMVLVLLSTTHLMRSFLKR